MVSVFTACSDTETCQRDLTTAVHISIHQMVYNSETEQYNSREYPITVTVKGVDRDSIIYDNVHTQTLDLPLQRNNGMSSFCMITEIAVSENDTIFISDTIDIYHNNEMELVSLECGCVTNSTITAIAQTVNRIDSIVVDNPSVSFTNHENNLRIYLNR